MEKVMRIALAQMAVEDGNKEANLKKMEEAFKKASEELSDIVVMPELSVTGFVSKERMRALAEPREGKTFSLIQKMVRTYSVSLLYSFPEFISEEELYITTCFVNKDGEALAYYRKTHLFTDENDIFTKGDGWATVRLGSFSIGLLTCYDIEFPEPARALALQGVNLLIVNSANMAPYEYIHRLFTCARALENQCFVVYCNRVGSNEKYSYCGESAVVGPDGHVIDEIEKDTELVKIIEISVDEIQNSKSEFNYITDRRPELYK